MGHVGLTKRKVTELLVPLAWAEGEGLPWDYLWAPLASAVSGMNLTDSDIEAMLDNAGAFIVERQEQGRSVYRLYHEALREHLRSKARATEIQRRITERLTMLTPAVPGGGKNWLEAHPYIRTHLAGHAAAARRLDALVTDPQFLVAADPERLLRVIGDVESEYARDVGRLYLQAAHRLRGRTAIERAIVLDLAAHQQGWGNRLTVRCSGVAWRISWARWQLSREALTFQSDGQEAVWGVALGEVDGRPVVATASNDRTARLWDARTGEPLRILKGHDDIVRGVALGEVDGRPVVATASYDGTACLWDARKGRCLRTLKAPLIGERSLAIGRKLAERFGKVFRVSHPRWFNCIALGHVYGRPIVAAGSNDGTAQLWDARRGEPLHTLRGHGGQVTAVALGEVDERPVVVTAGDLDQTARLWDARSGEALCSLRGHNDRVSGVALGEVDGRPVVATASGDRSVRLWDARSGHEQVLFPIDAAAYGVALSGGRLVVGAGRGVVVIDRCDKG